ncbi:MAG: hypothetical protein H6810_11655 [Phycisphaeraceae bacterium]|nr:MAG: hypothetical protein H6810_11655 [Phycisphaeraceae bacterium]
MMFLFVLFAGMLFWTKLRLVSNIPRSAYAVPKQTQTEDASTKAPDERSQADPDKPDDPAEDAGKRDQHD